MTNEKSRRNLLSRCIHWKPARFIQLFVFIILVIVLSPVLNKSPLLMALLAAFFLNVLIVSLSSAGFSPWGRRLLVALWLFGTLIDLGALLTGNPSVAQIFDIVSDLLRGLLTVICVVFILRYVLKSREVTVDTIFGAFVAYFLIAFAFSSLYHAVAIIEPASFSMSVGAKNGDSVSSGMPLSYFSFVTIATLGYGDIVPSLPVTQMLAILEAVIGQFYMAVVVAWLVSVLAVRRLGSDGGGQD
jgi:hypothetical protein